MVSRSKGDHITMANALPPGFQGTDFSQWGSWQPINIDGLPYYQVPGHEQYVFDPYDGAYGSIKINPRYVEQAYAEQNPEPGIVEQVVPALGTVGGLYLSNQLFNPSTATAASAATEGGTSLLGSLFGGGETVASTAGQSASSALGYGGNGAGFMGAEFTPGATGGETSILGSAAPYLGIAGAGLGAYGVYNAIEADDPKAGAISGAGFGAGLGAAAPLLGLASGPLGWGAMGLMALGGAGLGAGLTSLFGHESTREAAQKHTKSLKGQAKDDANWQNYVSGMREQFNAAPPDPSKPFAGKYANWQEYEAAGLEAPDLTGVYGNLKTFGPQWASLSEDQRVAVTQGIINAGLYKSKKGEVEITDPTKAKTIYESVLAEGVKPATQKPTTEKASLSTGDDMKIKNKGISKAQKDWVDKYSKGGKTTDIASGMVNQPIRGNPSGASAMDLARSVAGGGAGAPKTGGGVQLAPKMAPPSNMPQRQMPGAQPSMGQAIAQQVQPQPLQRPSAQPQTDTADWMMKLRQRAMAQPQPMMGQTPPMYSRG